jgi:hypothetical protein
MFIIKHPNSTFSAFFSRSVFGEIAPRCIPSSKMTKKGADPPKLEAYEIIGAPQVSSIRRKTDRSAGRGMKRWDERDAMKDANSVFFPAW